MFPDERSNLGDADAGERSPIIYSIIESCKAAGVTDTLAVHETACRLDPDGAYAIRYWDAQELSARGTLVRRCELEERACRASGAVRGETIGGAADSKLVGILIQQRERSAMGTICHGDIGIRINFKIGRINPLSSPGGAPQLRGC